MPPLTRPPTSAETALADYMSSHAAAFQNAAAILGGPSAAQRTSRLLDDLSGMQGLTRRMRRELVALHQLLCLNRVSEPESLEAALFAAIDPMSPVVAEVCILSDGLLSHLRAVAAENADDNILHEELPAAA